MNMASKTLLFAEWHVFFRGVQGDGKSQGKKNEMGFARKFLAQGCLLLPAGGRRAATARAGLIDSI